MKPVIDVELIYSDDSYTALIGFKWWIASNPHEDPGDGAFRFSVRRPNGSALIERACIRRLGPWEFGFEIGCAIYGDVEVVLSPDVKLGRVTRRYPTPSLTAFAE